jgi:hypothetical protein
LIWTFTFGNEQLSTVEGFEALQGNGQQHSAGSPEWMTCGRRMLKVWDQLGRI